MAKAKVCMLEVMGMQRREEQGYPVGWFDVGELTDRGRGIEARSYNMAWRRQKRLGLTTGGRTDEQRADMQKRWAARGAGCDGGDCSRG